MSLAAQAQLECGRPMVFELRDDILAHQMHRLCGLFPGVYPTGAQLRALQRRVQLWRNEQSNG